MSAVIQPTNAGLRGRAAKEPHSATAREILRVAICEFDEIGFSATSVGRIADRAGVSKSLVTYYFPTKAMLAAAVLNQAYAGGAFITVERQEVNPLEAIMEAVHHVTSSVMHGRLARAALRLREEPELEHLSAPGGYSGWLTRISDYLDEARRAGTISEETDVVAESRFMVVGVIGLITLAMETADFQLLVDDATTITRQRIALLIESPRTVGRPYLPHGVPNEQGPPRRSRPVATARDAR